ncbi:MAG: nucleotidyltransferase family protein [Ruminococcaceae bacterium]|nr:nucleotidyltransferase family protein [Oscillospiraceae bacterium]
MRDQNELRVGCVVMAAGNAERFGENKLAAAVGGKTLIERALDAVPLDALSAVCVVTQYDEVERLAVRCGFRCVRNDRPADGLSRTVRLGTEALAGECDAILYLVSDQPLLKRESVAALLDFCRAHPDRIVGASHGGRRGNPCVFPKKYFPELCALSGDVGGSAVIRAHEDDLLLFEIGGEELTDVDTKEALKELNNAGAP